MIWRKQLNWYEIGDGAVSAPGYKRDRITDIPRLYLPFFVFRGGHGGMYKIIIPLLNPHHIMEPFQLIISYSHPSPSEDRRHPP